ncbi:MAG: hypothetical protein U0132_15790, partial [Gemmatimonadaceae bacterium]
TWKSMGLERTQAIGRIVVHPTNPNIVYVAALGAPWSTNKERGLYKTTDGGTSWELVKFVSERAGMVDVALDPSNPDVVWAASWERVRTPYSLYSGGPGSALWKSTDAGKTWSEVKGNGFPETTKGRISIAVSLSNPKVMYTMVEADTLPNPAPKAQKGKPAPPKQPAQKRPSGLYRSEDGGATWTKTNSENTRPFYYSQVRVHPKNPNRVYWSSTPVKVSNDGGKTAMNATVGIHVDHHAMWIDPVDPDRMIVGNDGGIAISFDQGGNYDSPANLAIGQFYNLSYDFAVPYNVCAGAQDNGSWCGPSRRKQGGLTNAMWRTVGGGDGFVTAQDPTDPNTVYSESQGGSIGRLNVATGERTSLVKPQWRTRYDQLEDSVLIERGDTTTPETSVMKKRIADFRSRQKSDSAMNDLRWNWNTPYFISAHNPSTLYFGANRVLKSTKRGDEMYPISPDLSAQDTVKINVSRRTTGGITPDVTGAETYGTIVSLNESTTRPGILYAGTDDGRVWLTKNDGGAWEELTGRFPGVPAGTYVSRIEPSPHDSMTVFVSFDNHRNGDYMPYVYMSTDWGKTFTSIAANLPTGSADFVDVIRQDPVNKNLLFVGTDVGAYVSINMGRSWQRFMTGLPTVPVHDLRIHPRDHELIAATHGRSLWIVDIAPLQQYSSTVAAADAHLYAPTPASQWGEPPMEGQSTGNRYFQTGQTPYGAAIYYKLGQRSEGPVRIAVLDVRGDTLRTLTGSSNAGLNRVTWGFQGKQPPRRVLSVSQKRDSTLQMNRILFVLDSLEKAGSNAQMIQRLRQALTNPNAGSLGGGGGGGGGGAGGGGGGGGGFGGLAAVNRFNARPGEQGPGPGGGGGGGGGGGLGALMQLMGAATGGGGAGAFDNIDFNALQEITDLFTIPGRPAVSGGGFGGFGFMSLLGIGGGGFGGGGGGGGGNLVGPGEYLISVTLNGKSFRQVLKVERASGTGTVSAFFEEHD